MDSSQTFGVVYVPESNPQAPSKSLDELLTPSITFVRIQWVDLANTVRIRILPVSYFRRMFSNPRSRPGISLSKVALGLVGVGVAPGFEVVGEELYVPDLSSWRVCTYAGPGHASVMGWFQEMTPAPGQPLQTPICPRGLLERLVKDASNRAGVSFLVGVECEFMLLSATSPELVFVNYGDWSCARKTRTGSLETKVLEEIATCLLDAGIELQMYHAESAPGQYEIITGPLSPLEAADALVFTRETIYNIANKHGLQATFAPRLHKDSCGNAVLNEPRMPPVHPRSPLRSGRSCKVSSQGLLSHLPAVCALTMPTAASYARMVDGIWAGGTYACWGTYNREVPVRVCGPRDNARFEVKCVDGTSTPHLAIAGIIAAGLKGIIHGALLATGDCSKAAFEMTDDERKAVGLENPLRLPRCIEEARKALCGNDDMKEMLGGEFVKKYLSVNESMEKTMAGKNEQETLKKLIEYF